MSTVQNDIALSVLEHTLAARLRAERVPRGWSLSGLAIRPASAAP
ncbi:hypothetical protein AAC691_21645 [Nguyenibacter vanlangensis]|uniref:Uncharacterized protein n=1 Tax=Nguyenibacter vanlangensis TaxID=1216886 RepID=A0ABZ3D4U7_9PROT